MMSDMGADFRVIFQGVPDCYLILSPDFRIVAVTDAYLVISMTTREQIIGRGLFEVFPDNPDDPKADGVANLTRSLKEVLMTKKTHTMPVQRYDIPHPDSGDGKYYPHYWRPSNSPILSEDGKVLYIAHRVEEVTQMIDVLHDAMDKQQAERKSKNAPRAKNK